MSEEAHDHRGLAVVLVSGGLDSCVTLALAAEDHQVAMLHAGYGQRTAARERRAARAIADHYGIPAELRLEIELAHLGAIGGSSLTDTALEVPQDSLGGREIPNTYVPFRNAHFIASAVSWAEVIGAQAIYIGAVEEDSSGYPDCREVYYEVFEDLIQVGTGPAAQIHLVTPLIRMKKAEIVAVGLSLGAPLNQTWSCYTREDKACGHCESCLLRLRGFEQAGAKDPIEYAG